MRLRGWQKRFTARRLRLRPGDAVVVHLAEDFGSDVICQMARDLKDRFPDNQVLVITKGAELTLERRAQGAPTTVDHVEAVSQAIQRAGGPDRVRFAPVAIEAMLAGAGESNADGPVMVWFEGREDALVDIFFKRVEDEQS